MTKILLMGFLMIGCGLVFINGGVFAASQSETLGKILLRGLPICYGNTYITNDIIDASYGDVTLSEIFTEKGKKVSEDTILVPNRGFGGSTISQDIPAVSCMQVFEGYSGGGGDIKGLLDLYGKKFQISSLGFHKVDGGSGGESSLQCMKVGYSYMMDGVVRNDNYSNEMCFSVDGNGKVFYGSTDMSGAVTVTEDLVHGWGENGESKGDISAKLEFVTNNDSGAKGVFQLVFKDDGNNYSASTIDITCDFGSFESVTFSGLKGCLENGIRGKTPSLGYSSIADEKYVDVTVGGVETNKKDASAGGSGNKWQKDGKGTAAYKALGYFAGLDKFKNVTFSEQEKFDLLQWYVGKVIEDSSNDVGLDLESCYDDISELGRDYGVLNDGKWCKIQGWEKVKGKFNVIRDKIGEKEQAMMSTSFEGVLRKIRKIDTSQIDLSSGLKIGVEDEEEGTCYKGAGALGWLLCPIIDGISKIGDRVWGWIETNFLQIQAGELFKNDGGLETAWGIFRNIANVVFIVLFMFVIFSQLTGIGIDNYGIKKILPKLIVVAILINLSFVICALLVDLSNILGSGLNQLFTGLAGEVPVETGEASVLQNLAMGAFTVGGIAGGFLFTLLNPLLAASAALAVMGVMLSVLVSILFMFFILIVRNAGVVILIAIAPVAIVCYMLPNTEKLFKRWVDLLKAVLIVYPICGLMIGAGKLAGNLLASTQNEGMIIAGMIVEVLPFFLIPMMLRQSLQLMGNIGARLHNAGQRVGRGASRRTTGAIRNSERFKDWSQFQQGRTGERRAGRLMRRLSGRANLSERDQERLRKAQDVVLARRKNRQENEVRTHRGYADAMMYKQDRAVDAETRAIEKLNDPTVRAAEAQAVVNEERLQQSKARTTLMSQNTRNENLDQLMARWNTAFDSGNTADLDALTNVIYQRYGSSGAGKIGDSLYSKQMAGEMNAKTAQGMLYRSSMETLQQTMGDNGRLASDMKTKAPDAFQMIGDGGMRFDKNNGKMVYEDMSYFTNNNKTATKVSDWASASTSALQRGLDSGQITDKQLDELLTNEDLRTGLQSEDGKLEALQAAKYNRQHNPSGMGPALDNKTASNNYEAEEKERRKQQALENARVIDVRRYKPKGVGGGQTEHTVRVMDDGRMLDENNNEFTDIDLYDRSE